nr:MAG TPA: hypothetical protein [Caudoviricetes sp.]
MCALIGALRYTPNKNRLTHDRPREGQKATINHARIEKRVNK